MGVRHRVGVACQQRLCNTLVASTVFCTALSTPPHHHPSAPPFSSPRHRFCHHASTLFLPWHRPYLYQVEVGLVAAARRVAARFVHGATREALAATAERIRLPYWDWTRRWVGVGGGEVEKGEGRGGRAGAGPAQEAGVEEEGGKTSKVGTAG